MASPTSLSPLPPNPLPPKFFKALVSGVVKMTLLQDPSITQAVLIGQIFSPNGVEDEQAENIIAKIQEITKTAARQTSSVSELQKALSAAAASTSFTAEQNDAFLSAWKTEGPKVHQKDVQDSDRNNRGMGKVAWRVDVTTQSRHASELNEASAILQVTSTAPASSSAKASESSFQFEMNRSELSGLLQTMNDINNVIQKRAGVVNDTE